ECKGFSFGDTCSILSHCSQEHTGQFDNLFGRCLCLKGWKGDLCKEDVDECLGTNNQLCPFNAVCDNTQGSFRCTC
ncbi:unnamed protein product, partial [Lymnaea stagnalis]